MELQIVLATEEDVPGILALYKQQIGRPFCPWTEHYPGQEEIAFDMSRKSLFVGKNSEGTIISAVSIDDDPQVEALEYWTGELAPGGELSRLAVAAEYQNQGIAQRMLLFGMEELKRRGFRSVHFLVNRLNEKALRSYNHLNFSNVGEVFMYEQPFYCYEKEL